MGGGGSNGVQTELCLSVFLHCMSQLNAKQCTQLNTINTGTHSLESPSEGTWLP